MLAEICIYIEHTDKLQKTKTKKKCTLVPMLFAIKLRKTYTTAKNGSAKTV